jgi:hypothetical protein
MGDSNMIGANTDPRHRNYGPDSSNFFNIIARHFDFDFECHAKNGASNDHIIRMTRQWIDSCNDPDKFVFIGWSTWEREEHQVDNTYYDIDAWCIYHAFNTPPELEIHADRLKQKLEGNPNYMDMCAQSWAGRIYEFAKYLESKNVGYLFWNAYSRLTPPGPGQAEFDHRFVKPYTDCFNQYWYLKQIRNHPTQANDPYHFDAQGHRKWADFLIQWITDWNILDKK